MFSLSIKEGLLQDKLNEIRTDTRASVCLQEGTISFEMLADLYERFWSRDSSVTMEQLVKSGSIQWKTRKPAGSEYSESFKNELGRLRAIQEEKEYQAMIERDGVVGGGFRQEKVPSMAQVNKEVKEQVTAVLNVLLTVFGTVYAIWYVTRTGWDPHIRVLLCLFGGILVLVADAAMYNVYYRKIEEARVTERRKKVTKKVLKRLV